MHVYEWTMEGRCPHCNELVDELEPGHPLADAFQGNDDKLVWHNGDPAVVGGHGALCRVEFRDARGDGYAVKLVLNREGHEYGIEGPLVVFEEA